MGEKEKEDNSNSIVSKRNMHENARFSESSESAESHIWFATQSSE